MISIILLLIILAVIIIFSVQNASPVTVSFLKWSFEASLAIVIFLAILSGSIITLILLYSSKLKNYLRKQSR
ncbi:MAG: lipopolysaccharide assembly protein LapA domain-containing protein [Thermodesulfovibrionales bacterium]